MSARRQHFSVTNRKQFQSSHSKWYCQKYTFNIDCDRCSVKTSLSVSTPLGNVTFQLLPSRSGVYFSAVWIWAGIVICFGQWNCRSDNVLVPSPGFKRTYKLPLPLLAPYPAMSKLVWRRMRDHMEQRQPVPAEAILHQPAQQLSHEWVQSRPEEAHSCASPNCPFIKSWPNKFCCLKPLRFGVICYTTVITEQTLFNPFCFPLN